MPLHPKLDYFLKNFPPMENPDLETIRSRNVAILNQSSPPVASVETVAIPGEEGDLPIRIYTPDGAGPFPVFVYYHGGGFVYGNLDTHDTICRIICNETGQLVIAVEYRLAPEHPFPAAPYDAYYAASWISKNAKRWNGDVTKLTVGGDSAGGNLAAAVSLMAKENGGPKIANLIMLYPVTDMRKGVKQKLYPSYKVNGQGYFLTQQTMGLFGQLYFQNPADAEHKYASPMLVEDVSGFPRTLLITAEYDPLRDEGEQYVAKLHHAGVEVELFRAAGLIHGFFNLFALMNADDDLQYIYDKIARFLKEDS